MRALVIAMLSCSSDPHGAVQEDEHDQGAYPPLAEQDDGLTDRAQAAEEAPGGTGTSGPEELVAEDGVGPHNAFDLGGGGLGVAELVDDPQAREPARAELVAFDHLGTAEEVALIEVKAEFLARFELPARLDLGRDHLQAVRRAVPERLGQQRRRHRQDVELDNGRQLQERIVVRAHPVIVQGEGVAFLGQPLATGQHLGAPGDVLAYLDHGLDRRQDEVLFPDQERLGRVHESQLVAHQCVQANIEDGVHQHIGGHRVAVRPLRAWPSEEQLIAMDL